MTNRITPEPSRSNAPKIDPDLLFVECLGANESQKFVCYSPEIQGLNLHWIASERRTVPCFEDHSLCYDGHKESNLKWRCYVHCFSVKKKAQVFVQLTWEAWQSWLGQIREGVSLRGQMITVHRTTKKNGRLWVEVDQYFDRDKGKMPEARDCKLSVYRLLKFNPLEAQKSARLAPGRVESTNGVFLG